MRLNLDLVREILLAIEGVPFTGVFRPIPLNFPDHSPAIVSRHVEHLHHAGLIEAVELPVRAWLPTRLTWEGHNFLDMAKSHEAWETAKGQVAVSGDGGSIAVADRLLWDKACEMLDRPDWDCGTT